MTLQEAIDTFESEFDRIFHARSIFDFIMDPHCPHWSDEYRGASIEIAVNSNNSESDALEMWLAAARSNADGCGNTLIWFVPLDSMAEFKPGVARAYSRFAVIPNLPEDP